MADIFTYQHRDRNNGQVASSDYAVVSIGNKQNALTQSVDVNYGQKIEEVTQVGSTQIYWMPGRPSGTITIQALVGKGGFFAGWKNQKCGVIANSTVRLNKSRCGFAGGGKMTFRGGIVESVTAQLNTQRQTIVHGATIKIASLSA